MPHDPKHFTVVDPRTFDGDPFDVASRAVAQVEAILVLAAEQMDIAEKMARNAELERQCLLDQDVDAAGWPGSPVGRKWSEAEAQLGHAIKALHVLRRAAGYNPKARV